MCQRPMTMTVKALPLPSSTSHNRLDSASVTAYLSHHLFGRNRVLECLFQRIVRSP